MASSASKSDKTVGLKDKVEDEPINGSAITGSREIGMEKPPIIERFSAGLSPNEVKRAWTYCCLKGLKEIELPASCQTWNDIYKNCRSLMLVSIVINEKGIADYAETLDFATTELHWPEVFTNLMRKILGAYPNVFKENEGDQVRFNDVYPMTQVTEKNLLEIVGKCVAMLFSTAISMTDAHLKSQQACCKDGFISFLLQELLPKLHNIKWNKKNIREQLLCRAMDVIYNCCRISENIPYYEEHNAVDVLVEFRNETKDMKGNDLSITALFTLAYLINDKNNDIIVPNSQSIEIILEHLSCALTQGDHSVFGYHADELADALARIAVNDKNKVMICKANGAEVFLQMLEKAKDDKERMSACEALWTICFVKEGREAVSKLPELLEKLSELKLSKNHDLQRAADGVLWELKADNHATSGESSSAAKLRHGHVMISYQWEHQVTAVKISQLLKKRGYNIWIDVDKMEGSIMDAMAHAVEESEVVLICISRKYKLSPNCRSEAEYAFQLHKTIIPLMMEEEFRPDGWLGLLIGSKLWISFTNPKALESDVNTLVRHIGSKCLVSEDDVVPVQEIPSSAMLGKNGDQQSGQPPFGHNPIRHHPVGHHPWNSVHAFDTIDAKPEASQTQPGYPAWKRVEIDRTKKNTVLKWSNGNILEWLRQNEMAGNQSRSSFNPQPERGCKSSDARKQIYKEKQVKEVDGLPFSHVLPTQI